MAILARSPRPIARGYAAAGVRAFAIGSRASALRAQPLLVHLRIANRVAGAAASTGSAPAIRASAGLAARAMVRVRAARARGWSRIDGAWSTLAGHRALVTQATLLERLHPHVLTRSVIVALRAALGSRAVVDFGRLPLAAFYPWPRDGAFDDQRVVVDIDKPAAIALVIYGAGDAVVRTIETSVDPGTTTLTWDGTGTDGAILGAGEYRYLLAVRDRAGVRVRVPGLEQFTIARDTAAPKVNSGAVRIVGSGSARRAVATWSVEEVHSPVVSTWLVLARDGGDNQSVKLHDSIHAATVRRPITLTAGSWRATLVFIDGSGNRAQHPAGAFTVR